MTDIYSKAITIKGYRGPEKRAIAIECGVTKRDGVWLKVHDHIERGFEQVFKRAEDNIVERFEAIFDSIHNDFLLLSADTETKDKKQKLREDQLRNKLKENLVEVRSMVGESGKIPRLVAACKAYNTTAGMSQSS